jgi:hypothetical protein
MLADDVQSERDKDARQPGRERSADEWTQLHANVGYLHGAIHRAVIRGAIDSESVQHWAASQRLFERQPFRALRNWPSVKETLQAGAAKPRSLVDLWLLLHLPEPPEPGKRINTKALLPDLETKLKVEDWSQAPWCLIGADADEFQAKVARHLDVSRQRFEARLARMGWYQPKPRS